MFSVEVAVGELLTSAMSFIHCPTPRLLLTALGRIAKTPRVSLPSKVFLSTIIAIATSVAQTVPPPPKVGVPVPVAPALPQPPATGGPAAQPPALPLPAGPTAPAVPAVNAATAQESLVQLKYLSADVRDVLAYYETLTERRLIYSAQLVGQINLFITEQVAKSEAVKLIEMSLAINGFYIVPTEDEKIWRATGVGSNPKSVGVPFIDREELLPPNEQVVMYLFKLKWADPTELAQLLSTGVLVPNQAGFTSIVPLPKANALLVTENTAAIRTLIRVVKAIDVEPSEVVSEFLSLQRAQAEDVVTNLEKLFEKKDQQQAGAAPAAPGQPGQPGQPRVQRVAAPQENGDAAVAIEITGGMGTGPTEDNIIIGKVRLSADKRTNRIHIVTRPVNMKLIRTLIKEYDADVKLPEPGIRPLRYRPVEEVIDAVVAAIKDPGEKEGGAGGSTTSPTAGGAAQRPGGQAQNQTNRATGNDRFGGGAGGGLGGDSSGGTLGESLSTQERDNTPLAQQVGKSTIIADKRSNSIIVIGTPDVKEKVFSLLDKLDERQPQVQIEVIVGELRHTENEQFGLEYILRNGGILPAATGTGTTTADPNVVGFSDSGSPILNLNSLLSSQSINKILAGGGSGLSGFIAASNAFSATVKALESTNRFRVITKPHIFTTNGKRAVITSGDEVPVPTNIQSSFGGTTSTGNNLVSNSSIQFKPIELRLEVLPLVNSQREVSLDIVQNISERSGTTRIDNNDIPNISRRAIKTYVTVPNGGTLILGGLIKESLDNTRGGINKLVRIPIIGPLFGKTSKDKIRTELIVLMRPKVTMNPPETSGLREQTFQDFNIPPDFDQAILPQGIRATIPKAKVISQPRATAPVLREEPAPAASK